MRDLTLVPWLLIILSCHAQEQFMLWVLKADFTARIELFGGDEIGEALAFYGLLYLFAVVYNIMLFSHFLIRANPMAIKSSTFGRVELSGKDAARFVQHMNEDKANPLALAALARGREISEKIKKGEAFKMKRDA